MGPTIDWGFNKCPVSVEKRRAWRTAGCPDVGLSDRRLRGVLAAVLRRQPRSHLHRLPCPSVGLAVGRRAAGARPQRAQPAHLRPVQRADAATVMRSALSASPLARPPVLLHLLLLLWSRGRRSVPGCRARRRAAAAATRSVAATADGTPGHGARRKEQRSSTRSKRRRSTDVNRHFDDRHGGGTGGRRRALSQVGFCGVPASHDLGLGNGLGHGHGHGHCFGHVHGHSHGHGHGHNRYSPVESPPASAPAPGLGPPSRPTRATQPSTLRQTVKWMSNSGAAITVNGDGGFGWQQLTGGFRVQVGSVTN